MTAEPAACHYCGAPAYHIDLCHAQVPVCPLHASGGHQTQPIVAKEPAKSKP